MMRLGRRCTWTALLLTLGAQIILPAKVFTFDDFANAANLNLVESASLSNNRLRLTPAIGLAKGAAWLNTPVNVAGGFSTTFQFQITEPGGHEPDWEPGVVNTGADGFAFVIQNASPLSMGLFASGIGYYGIANSLAVEFDTWANKPSYCEPNGNHIAVQSLGFAENRPEHCAGDDFANPNLGIVLPSQNLSNGAVYTARIDYTPGQLSIYLEDLLTPLLTVPVNLSQKLALADDAFAYIGFTSSTGGAWENHDIVRWSFSDVPEPSTLLSMAAGLIAIARLIRSQRPTP